MHVFSSESAANAIKEHVKSLATYEYSLERRSCQKPPINKPTSSSHVETNLNIDDDDDLKVSSFLNKKLEKAQPPGNYPVSNSPLFPLV